ncbi:phosphoribulokinase/uridine kinase [Trichococcus palustris]|jgi:uridine kinase|uniref:Phosphoribulokinase/uridine kinase n=1 Tax=Trichococcus palustris TaxID=140314 RepID=A0A143YVB3_9LACT|nr:nucleoside kinase [Trichococcus palustris]CZQ99557.1 phosphoribulokinase/uridine kinase [Trichococcus palustris]SFK87407.1 uridine kinase [Trichococcus palustris]
MSETHLHEGRQTVKLGLIKVVHDLFPEETLKTSYSILEGVFCNLYGSILSKREVKQIELRLREWVEQDSKIELLYKEGGYYHYQVGDIIVKAVYPAFTETSRVEPFTILPFSYGFIVDFGDIEKGTDIKLIPPVQLSAAFEKNQRWMDNIDIELVKDVNGYIQSGRTMKLVSIAEALHEKEISIIADAILQHRRALRLLLVSGPSSSGKTSFAQRLSTQLEVNGLKPIALSLDHYFVDREHTPRDADGKYDFDSMEALDLPLLKKQIAQLINGERVEVPQFDFVTGNRLAEYKPMNVGPSEILIIEGIHALNPDLVTEINRNLTYKIYISALGGLNIDLMSRVPTSEIRLLRRLVRDDKYRGVSPENTIHQWESVRRGEYQNIFKFQEEADVMFNSSMLYEMNALRPFAEAALQKIPVDSPYFDTRERLMNLLTFFEPLDVSKVPFNSILREFIGGSIYYD